MRSNPSEAKFVAVDFVDQDAIIGDVAVPIAGVVTVQWMVTVFGRQWLASNQQTQHR
ncbi:MAG: hypothetical protein NTZ96_13570 [Burkholderiales bacterium]|nr:hypothetical protein [Burkholderiales bacterium]